KWIETPSRESVRVASNLLTRRGWRHFRAVHLLVFCGLVLAAAVIAGTSIIIFNLHNRALADRERELQNIALVLAEQTDRAIQAVDLIQTNLIERMHTLGIRSTEDFERQMSDHDAHVMLKEKINGLPQVESVALFNSDGNLINSSRFCPSRALN